MIDLEYLRKQLESFSKEREAAVQAVLRVEGAIALANHLIKDLEQDAEDGVTDPPAVITES